MYSQKKIRFGLWMCRCLRWTVSKPPLRFEKKNKARVTARGPFANAFEPLSNATDGSARFVPFGTLLDYWRCPLQRPIGVVAAEMEQHARATGQRVEPSASHSGEGLEVKKYFFLPVEGRNIS
jgi:hypothetical protein